MNIQAFILSFKEAFGETTELPLFFLYWNTCESGRYIFNGFFALSVHPHFKPDK